MKFILLVLGICILSFNTNKTLAQTLTQGLIAHYCLDGDAQDATGTKHGVLMNGASGTADRSNNLNGAISLDGIDDFIQLPSDPWITGDFTFSGWIKIKSVGSWPHLWGFGNGTNAENVFLSLGQGTNNQPHFTTHDCQSGGSYDRIAVPTTSPLNTWFHIVVTLVGSDVKIYKDNTLWVSSTTSIVPCFGIKDSAFIGKSNFTFNNNALVDADIDDFRFYNRLLTTQEISQLYELEASNNCGPSWPNSVNDLDSKAKYLRIFPNPTFQNFSIQTPEDSQIKSMKIFDQVGRLISFERIDNNIYLPSTLASGVYNIRGTMKDGSNFSSRLLLQ